MAPLVCMYLSFLSIIILYLHCRPGAATLNTLFSPPWLARLSVVPRFVVFIDTNPLPFYFHIIRVRVRIRLTQLTFFRMVIFLNSALSTLGVGVRLTQLVPPSISSHLFHCAPLRKHPIPNQRTNESLASRRTRTCVHAHVCIVCISACVVSQSEANTITI